MLLSLPVFKKKTCAYDVTIFQTPRYGDKMVYRVFYRTALAADNNKDAVEWEFYFFIVPDTVPNDYQARFIATGDVILIDEGRKGKTYYRLNPAGWSKINRLLVQPR